MSAVVASQRGARAARNTAITVWQTSVLLVNGSCVGIQSVARGDLKKRCQPFQIKTLSKAPWLKFNIYRYFRPRTRKKSDVRPMSKLCLMSEQFECGRPYKVAEDHGQP